MPEQLLSCAREAAWAGRQVLRSFLDKNLDIQEKSQGDYVTQADKASEQAVLGVIRRTYPDHCILAEEAGGDWAKARQYAEIVWVVDPLDGTTNFIHGLPWTAVSVAALSRGCPLAGVVLSVSGHQEYWAQKGQGAYLNGARLKTISDRPVKDMVLHTGFPFRRKEHLDDYWLLARELFLKMSDLRRTGSAALDLCLTAAGIADGYWELGVSPWDMAAGVLLVAEAGGRVSDFNGGGEYLWRGDVLAGSAAAHAFLLRHAAPWWEQGRGWSHKPVKT